MNELTQLEERKSGEAGVAPVTMAQPSPCASPGVRRRSDGSVRECLFFPVLERNEQERLEALVRRRERTGERDRQMGEDSRYLMENRPKRWTWGGPPGGEEGKYTWGGGGEHGGQTEGRDRLERGRGEIDRRVWWFGRCEMK